jgi:polyphosphate glucokinase
MELIGIDVGGTGIKAAVVETTTGELVTARVRIETPHPARPKPVVKATAGLVAELPAALHAGIGFPAVVLDGVVKTAANIDHSWIDTQADSLFADALDRRLVIGNDADAAGLAEMRFGAGRGQAGTVLMLTLGTGIGSALFRDGVLLPNTELGHLQVRGKDAERRAAASKRVSKGLSWPAWSKLLAEYVDAVDALLWPDLVIIGGGISKEADKFIHDLPSRVKCVPAALQNQAGIIGAAMLAAEAARLTSPHAAAGAA